jgi:Zn-dependent protease with chaperone function
VIEGLRGSFEGSENGWSQAVSATHPPSELRLERLEDPERQYPLPDPDSRRGGR